MKDKKGMEIALMIQLTAGLLLVVAFLIIVLPKILE